MIFFLEIISHAKFKPSFKCGIVKPPRSLHPCCSYQFSLFCGSGITHNDIIRSESLNRCFD